MKVVWALLVGVAAGIVTTAIFTAAFLTPTPVDPLEAYCQGAVDLWLLRQGADPFDPAVSVQLEGFDQRCREDVMSGEFAGRASVGPSN